MKRTLILLTALAAASCTTKGQNSFLVITKVLAPTASGAGATLTCTLDPGATEKTFLPLGPDNVGSVGLVVENHLVSQVSQNPIDRIDTTEFLPHQAVVDFEVILPNGAAGPGFPEAVRPASAATVKSGETAPVGVVLFTQGQFGAVAAGSFVRTTVHLEGKLRDGSTVKSAELEYLFQICSSSGCANNACL